MGATASTRQPWFAQHFPKLPFLCRNRKAGGGCRGGSARFRSRAIPPLVGRSSAGSCTSTILEGCQAWRDRLRRAARRSRNIAPILNRHISRGPEGRQRQLQKANRQPSAEAEVSRTADGKRFFAASALCLFRSSDDVGDVSLRSVPILDEAGKDSLSVHVREAERTSDIGPERMLTLI